MRISEANFEKEYADTAKEVIKELNSGAPSELNEYEQKIQRLNAEKILEGYRLKLAAKQVKERGASSGEAIEEYCYFISTKAFWHD